MKPQTSAYLDSADEAIRDAKRILAVNIPRRLAYYAQFHAAQALIFERTDKVAKTHKGVDREFHKLAMVEPTFAPGIAASLTTAYHFKQLADYETGLAAVVTAADAGQVISAAEHFVASVRRSLTPPVGTPGP